MFLYFFINHTVFLTKVCLNTFLNLYFNFSPQVYFLKKCFSREAFLVDFYFIFMADISREYLFIVYKEIHSFSRLFVINIKYQIFLVLFYCEVNIASRIIFFF